VFQLLRIDPLLLIVTAIVMTLMMSCELEAMGGTEANLKCKAEARVTDSHRVMAPWVLNN
jgi:hypothetical protein